MPDPSPGEGRTDGQQLSYDLRQAHRQLEQLSIAAQAFSLELDSDRLFREIANQTYEILRADQVIVYSHGDHQLQPAALSPNLTSATHPGNEHVRWCMRYREPRVEHATSYPGIRNAICVPLVSTQHRVLGVIEARNKRTGGSFTEQDVRTAVCLARIASSSVDRATLFNRIEEWKQSIETLLTINATINQQLDPDAMVRQLVVNVCGFLEADGGVAGIVIYQDEEPRAVSDSLYFAGLIHRFERHWRSGKGIPGTVMETEFPLLIDDYRNNPIADPLLVQQFEIGSCICVPIKNAKEQVLGFFKLFRRPGMPPFTWQDAAFLESLGNTAAVAIENFRLMRTLELKNAQIKSLSQDNVRRLEQTRQHIARELHDQAGQVLVGLQLRLQVLSGLLSEDQADAKQELGQLRIELNRAAAQMKDLAKALRPPILDELGFEACLRQLVTEYRRQVDCAIFVRFKSRPALDSDAETALFRITQESLTNIAKHARASQVHIQFYCEQDGQRFSIRDNGCGFDPNQTTQGLGLIGIHERVRMLGGTLSVQSKPGEGTRLEIVLPRNATS